MATCFLCKSPTWTDTDRIAEDIITIHCDRCGVYVVSKWAASDAWWSDLSAERAATISGYIRLNQGLSIADAADVKFLRELPTPSVAAKAEQLFRMLAKLNPLSGAVIQIPRVMAIDDKIAFLRTHPDRRDESILYGTSEELLPWLSYGSAVDEQELRYLLYNYLRDALGLVEGATEEIVPGGIEPAFVKITPNGWEHLQSAGIADGAVGFVATWFDDEMKAPWEQGFFPAINQAGYAPLRIDRKEHNNRIDDEIVATIRGSRFMVADFTGNRAGVYYEAGFAGGLGKPVIWTVRRDWLARLHFDTRQFNHIVWEPEKIEDFRTALVNRIEATLGHGPIRTL